jgi:hypothetical protein
MQKYGQRMRACGSQMLHENQFALLLFRASFSLSFSPSVHHTLAAACLCQDQDCPALQYFFQFYLY